MPDQPPRTRKIIYPLSVAHRTGQLVRVSCGYCNNHDRHYLPADLIKIFGDMDMNRLAWKMKCQRCGRGDNMDAQATLPAAVEHAGIKVRRLVDIKIYKRPVWREER